ncbi:MAG: S8 family peptidase [Bacteroidota bacterium]
MNRKISFILVISLIIFLGSGTAVEKLEEHIVPGKMIIQFREAGNQNVSLHSVEETFTFVELKFEKCLSAQLGIWLVSYDVQNAISDRMLLRQLKRNACISNAQFEHYISLREVIPDDTEFVNQWALMNTGQNGGVTDADIDATDAWEISVNNGTSVLGDTLVMAIVDDGFAMGHDDMNYWKNRQEVPNNGVDDDNNGYIDDYDGWNAYYSSGYIQPKDHGQHVAGIAGARGNNALGVCGVNWNGRVMTVCGSSTIESTVVEAYGYVYKMRSLYDETNGQKGAYVVVSNCSFGVDLGDPEDFPVWGAMYDSLGGLGILNVAATTNAPNNVDLVGDVPTTFTTDHMIGVTNTTNEDKKNFGAGWGPVSIDLGAPGKGIISTRIPNTYGYKSGTSMAAPQVTGSIALMFSAADENFMNKYNEEPEFFAVFMKNILLDGADLLPGFDTLCVSGGRLNVHQAIQKLVNPRMDLSLDTLKVILAPDSVMEDTISITNLVGFELPYEAEIANIPSWVNYSTPVGVLPGNSLEELIFSFDAGGMSLGTYYCEMIITDVAGMPVSLVIEMEVGYPQSIRDEILNRSKLSCFPNPFSSDLNISIELSEPAAISLRLFSLNGQLIRSRDETLLNGLHTIRWDGMKHDGPPGVYILHVSGKDIDESVRLIKKDR